MRQIGDLKILESVLVADVSHLFHSFVRGPRSLHRNGGIRNRQTTLPVSHDVSPFILTVEQWSTKPHRPNHQVASVANAIVDAIDTNSAQINFDRRSLPQTLRITAQHHDIQIIGRHPEPDR